MKISNILLALFAIVLFPMKAWAYLDPGTGSVILQVLAALFFGALFTIKSFWHKLKAKFSKATPADTNE